jgi:hypothetical protein
LRKNELRQFALKISRVRTRGGAVGAREISACAKFTQRRKVGGRLRREHRNLDRVMSLDEHPPKPTILVVVVKVVPMRAIDARSGRRAPGGRLDLRYARLGCRGLLGIMVEEGFQLGKLELDRSERLIHLRFPRREQLVEDHRRRLDAGDALVLDLVRRHHVSDMLVDGVGVDREVDDDLLTNLLHEILQHKLQVRFHCVELLLQSRVVVVIQDGCRLDVSDTKCYHRSRGRIWRKNSRNRVTEKRDWERVSAMN